MKPSIAFSMIHCGLSMTALGALSMSLGAPLVIPAVGASAYLVFSTPRAEVAAPRNVLMGHALGASIGWAMIRAFRLENVPGGLTLALTWPRLGAIAIALAITIGVLRALCCSHPPAGATPIIVASGSMPDARHVLDFVVAALVVVVYASVACRSLGYPLWRASPDPRRD